MFPNSAFYIESKGAKKPHVLVFLGWSCGGLWRFLNGVFVPDLDGDRSTKSQTTYVPKFSFLCWIYRCKEPSCPWSPWLELWRTLEVPDWCFGSWSWWGQVSNVPNNICSEIQLSILNLKVLWRTLEVPDWGFESWSWTGNLKFHKKMSLIPKYPKART